MKSERKDAKDISLRGELWGNWGFSSKVKDLKEFANYLSQNGFNVTCHIEPINGLRDQNFLFIKKSDDYLPIFTNKKDQHKDGVYGSRIRKEIYSDLINRIFSLVDWMSIIE